MQRFLTIWAQVQQDRSIRRSKSSPKKSVRAQLPEDLFRASQTIRPILKIPGFPTSPKHLRGRAISPKAPRPQTWTTAEPSPAADRTARRSVPTWEPHPATAQWSCLKPTCQ